MFNELEKVLKNLESELKFLSCKIEGLERKVDHVNGQILATTEKDGSDVEFFSRKCVAEKLGVSIDTITNYINNGELECVRLGRRILIEKKALLSFIDKNTQK